jgi:putative aminopeptidase FrvX
MKMDKQLSLKIIKSLSNAPGASAFEDDVLRVIREYGRDYGEFREDSLRNLYLARKSNTGRAPLIQLDAHTDEVGFMVQSILPNGTLKIIPLGGWVPNNVPAHKVRVRNADGEYISGIVASKPPHYMTEEEKAKAVKLNDLVVDVGASSREEAVRDHRIRIGEPIVPDVDFEYIEKHDLMIGKAFDCRVGCACILGTLDRLRDENLNTDLVGAFAVQEELGLRGATVTANTVKPDAAIVFEGCPADDTFGDSGVIQTAIKKGPMLRHADAKMITNPRFQRFALSLGEKLGIPVQEAVRTGGATNGAAINLSNSGVPVIVIGIPVRYIHTHYGIASYYDYEKSVELGAAVIRELNREIIAGF